MAEAKRLFRSWLTMAGCLKSISAIALLSIINSGAGKIQVGVRTLAELDEYLCTGGLFSDCSICKTLVIDSVLR